MQRYLLWAGLVEMVFWGMRLAEDWQAKRWVCVGVLVFPMLSSGWHQYQMLALPDQISEYRAVASDIERSGLRYGMSWFAWGYPLTALSNERIQFAMWDRSFPPPYQKRATESSRVAVVWPAVRPPPFEFAQKQFFGQVLIRSDGPKNLPDRLAAIGHEYVRVGETRLFGELSWAPYERRGLAEAALPIFAR